MPVAGLHQGPMPWILKLLLLLLVWNWVSVWLSNRNHIQQFEEDPMVKNDRIKNHQGVEHHYYAYDDEDDEDDEYGDEGSFKRSSKKIHRSKLRNEDILLGLDKPMHKHGGNIWFRKFIASKVEEYIALDDDDDNDDDDDGNNYYAQTSKYLDAICQDIDKEGRKFMAQKDYHSNFWREISNPTAREKVALSLRQSMEDKKERDSWNFGKQTEEADGWQSNADLSDRHTVLRRIIDLLWERNSATRSLQDENKMAKILEGYLYWSALNKHEYIQAPLRHRVDVVFEFFSQEKSIIANVSKDNLWIFFSEPQKGVLDKNTFRDQLPKFAVFAKSKNKRPMRPTTTWGGQIIGQLLPTTWVGKIIAALAMIVLSNWMFGSSGSSPDGMTLKEPQERGNAKNGERRRPKEYHVYADASKYHLGGIVMKDDALLFSYSRELKGAQKKYTPAEKELLSIVEILQKYKPQLFRRKLILHTDHKHLLYASSPAPRIVKWRTLLEEYNVQFEGYDAQNEPVECCKRPETSSSSQYSPPESKKKPKASESKKPKASSKTITVVGTNEHPGMEAFSRWCDAESSLYRIYTLYNKDSSVVPALPLRYPKSRVQMDVEVTNHTNFQINVFSVNPKTGRHVPCGTIPSNNGVWRIEPHINMQLIFEDAIKSIPVLHYVPCKVNPNSIIHRFALIEPEIGSGGENYYVGISDRMDPFPASHLDKPVEGIQWTLEHLLRCCKEAESPNWMIGEANTLQKYLSNIMTHPEEWKYRNLRLSSEHFSPIWGSPLRGLLLAVGFVEDRGFCRLGRSDGPLPNNRIQDVSLLCRMLSDWIWKWKKANGHKTKFEFEWNENARNDEGNNNSQKTRLEAAFVEAFARTNDGNTSSPQLQQTRMEAALKEAITQQAEAKCCSPQQIEHMKTKADTVLKEAEALGVIPERLFSELAYQIDLELEAANAKTMLGNEEILERVYQREIEEAKAISMNEEEGRKEGQGEEPTTDLDPEEILGAQTDEVEFSSEMDEKASNDAPSEWDEMSSLSNYPPSAWDEVSASSKYPPRPELKKPKIASSEEDPRVFTATPENHINATSLPEPTSLDVGRVSEVERKRQLEARLVAVDKRNKGSDKKKSSRPLSSPHTNMMQWSSSQK